MWPTFKKATLTRFKMLHITVLLSGCYLLFRGEIVPKWPVALTGSCPKWDRVRADSLSLKTPGIANACSSKTKRRVIFL